MNSAAQRATKLTDEEIRDQLRSELDKWIAKRGRNDGMPNGGRAWLIALADEYWRRTEGAD